MLYMGSRVYLSEKNPAYTYFQRNGIIIYSIEQDFDRYGISRPDKDIAENNRYRLDMIFSKEKVLNDLKNVYEVLTSA